MSSGGPIVGGERPKLRVFYDGGCGVCEACAGWALRRDTHRRLDFVGQLDGATIPPDRERAAFEALCETTVVAWERDSGRTYTRHRAVARVLDALPLGTLLSWPLKLPLIGALFGLAYDAFSPRRHRVSELLGMAVCTPPQRAAPTAGSERPPETAG